MKRNLATVALSAALGAASAQLLAAAQVPWLAAMLLIMTVTFLLGYNVARHG